MPAALQLHDPTTALALAQARARALPPVPFPQAEKVVLLASGWRHTVVVSDSGRVFTWGRGVNGQLGHGDELDLWVLLLALAPCCLPLFGGLRGSASASTSHQPSAPAPAPVPT
jgi:hypothetical protein